MVVVRPVVGAQRLVRAAWRAARRLGADLDVVMAEGGRDEEGARQRELVRRLAVMLGAHMVPVPEGELAATVVRLARERGVTRLAMSAPRGRGPLSRLRPELLTTLLAELEGVDLLLIAERPRAGEEEER